MNPLYKLPRKSEVRRQAWKKLIEEQEQSSLSISKFCQEQDVNIKTFTKWKIKLGRRDRNTFIPIAIETSESTFSLAVYEIRHKNGFSLKCDDQANMKTVIQ
jgi:RNA-binding protein YlmH